MAEDVVDWSLTPNAEFWPVNKAGAVKVEEQSTEESATFQLSTSAVY